MRIWQDRGGLTTQWIDNEVRERVCEIAKPISVMNRQGAAPEQSNLVIALCIPQLSDLASEWPLWKLCMADKPNLDGHKLKAALDEFAEVGLRERNNWLDKTPTKKRRLVHVGMYFMTPMHLLLILMMCRQRKQQGRNLGSPVFAIQGALQRIDQFPCRAIQLYHPLCGSRHCCKEGGWKQYSAILIALAWRWWIDTSDSYIHRDTTISSYGIAAIVSLWTPARISESCGAAGRSQMEIVVHTPVMLPQSSITIQLPDE